MLIAIFVRPIYSNSKYKYVSLISFIALIALLLNMRSIYNFTQQIPVLQKYGTYFRNIGKYRMCNSIFLHDKEN